MQKTTIYLSAGQKQALERAAKATSRNQADLIREGVDLVVARYLPDELKLPLFSSGHHDLAETVEEALEGFGER